MHTVRRDCLSPRGSGNGTRMYPGTLRQPYFPIFFNGIISPYLLHPNPLILEAPKPPSLAGSSLPQPRELV